MIETGATHVGVATDHVIESFRNRMWPGYKTGEGIEPALDAADGYPGIAGIGPVAAARLLNRNGIIESFPPSVLGNRRDLALLFKDLATLRTNERLFGDVDELRWRGPTDAFAACAANFSATRLLERSRKAPIA